ncbi:hypothetical protein EVAR_31579_1 [Eumeta japonica]|uniref:Uncharacterized protein n=1 Tax=Eumeta variegata TaxID=151549 RepID=A0A4C1V7P0_EUMVA|nr:hypothetical protein EVAR_31579_1 [Eumeta japonica]
MAEEPFGGFGGGWIQRYRDKGCVFCRRNKQGIRLPCLRLSCLLADGPEARIRYNGNTSMLFADARAGTRNRCGARRERKKEKKVNKIENEKGEQNRRRVNKMDYGEEVKEATCGNGRSYADGNKDALE